LHVVCVVRKKLVLVHQGLGDNGEGVTIQLDKVIGVEAKDHRIVVAGEGRYDMNAYFSKGFLEVLEKVVCRKTPPFFGLVPRGCDPYVVSGHVLDYGSKEIPAEAGWRGRVSGRDLGSGGHFPEESSCFGGSQLNFEPVVCLIEISHTLDRTTVVEIPPLPIRCEVGFQKGGEISKRRGFGKQVEGQIHPQGQFLLRAVKPAPTSKEVREMGLARSMSRLPTWTGNRALVFTLNEKIF
jgi:hypothetical protein